MDQNDGYFFGGSGRNLFDKLKLCSIIPTQLQIIVQKPFSALAVEVIRQISSLNSKLSDIPTYRLHFKNLFDLALCSVSIVSSESHAIYLVDRVLFDPILMANLKGNVNPFTSNQFSRLHKLFINFMVQSTQAEAIKKNIRLSFLTDSFLTRNELWMLAPIEWLIKNPDSMTNDVAIQTIQDVLQYFLFIEEVAAKSSSVVVGELRTVSQKWRNENVEATKWFTLLKIFISDREFYLNERIGDLARQIYPFLTYSCDVTPNFEATLGGTFESFYLDLVHIYISSSFGNAIFSDFLFFFLTQKLTNKRWRKTLIKEAQDVLHLLKLSCAEKQEQLDPNLEIRRRKFLKGFFLPYEVDQEILNLQLNAIQSNPLIVEFNPFLYQMFVHHLSVALIQKRSGLSDWTVSQMLNQIKGNEKVMPKMMTCVLKIFF